MDPNLYVFFTTYVFNFKFVVALFCCVLAFSSWVRWGYSSLPRTGFSLTRLLLLWSAGSRHLGFSSCSRWASVVVARGLQLPMECKNLPRPGLEPILPASAGRFEFTVLPGQSRPVCIFTRNYWDSCLKLPFLNSIVLYVNAKSPHTVRENSSIFLPLSMLVQNWCFESKGLVVHGLEGGKIFFRLRKEFQLEKRSVTSCLIGQQSLKFPFNCNNVRKICGNVRISVLWFTMRTVAAFFFLRWQIC